MRGWYAEQQENTCGKVFQGFICSMDTVNNPDRIVLGE